MCLTDNVLSPNETLDLATEAGDYVLELNSRGKEYAKKVMDQRGSYVLVKVTGKRSSVFS